MKDIRNNIRNTEQGADMDKGVKMNQATATLPMKRTHMLAAVLAAVLALTVAAVGLMPAYAATERTGTYAGITWHIDTDGVLTLGSDTEQQTLRTGWGNGGGGNTPAWPWWQYRSDITAVKIADGGIKAEGVVNRMFQDLGSTKKLEYLDLTGLDTSDVTQARAMFGAVKAKRFDIGGCDFEKLGGMSTWGYDVTGMFRAMDVDVMVLPSYDGSARLGGRGERQNFLTGTGAGDATSLNGKGWVKVDLANSTLSSAVYKIYDDNNPDTRSIVYLKGSNLAGTWVDKDLLLGTVKVIKEDENDYGLAGAELKLSSTGTYEDTATITTTKFAHSINVIKGMSLTIEETKVPDGYDPAFSPKIIIEFDENGNAYSQDAYGGVVNYPGNQIILKNYPLGDVTVTKVWDDDGAENVEHPEVVLTLKNGLKNENDEEIVYTTGKEYKDGSGKTHEAGETAWVQAGANKLTYTFKNLPLYDSATGGKLTYTADEPDVPVVENPEDLDNPKKYVKSVNGLTVTNTTIDKKEDITVTKTWHDLAEEAASRPKITLHLTGGGETYDTGNYDPSAGEVDENWNIPDGSTASTTWTYTFRDLPVYDDAGNTIDYSLTEDPISGYTSIVDGMYIVNNSSSVDDIKPTVPKQTGDGEQATYTQQSTPDRLQTIDGEKENTQNITDKMFNYVVDNYDPNNQGYFMPTKDAVWTNDEKTNADIIMSYKEPIHPVYFYGSLCGAHGQTSGLLIGQLNEIAKEADVKYFLEGIDYLPPATIDGKTAVYTGEKTTSVDTAATRIGTIERGETLDTGTQQFIQGQIKTTTPGKHANIRAFAQDIVDSLKGLSDNEKPAQIVLSFDYWAWAACAASLEGHNQDGSFDVSGDIDLFREAAGLLKEYYEEGKVTWLMPENVGGGDKAKLSTELGLTTLNLSSTNRDRWTYYLYPDSAQDFVIDPQAIPDHTKIDEGRYHITSTGDLANYILGNYVAGDWGTSSPGTVQKYDYTLVNPENGKTKIKYTTTSEWAWQDTRNWGNTSKGETRLNGERTSSDARTFYDTEDVRNYYTLSKRMAFYQYALLNPAMFLQVTADSENPSNWKIPHIDDWMLADYNGTPWREYVDTLSYSADNTAEVLAAKNKQYNSYTITDTLNEGLVIAPDNSTAVEFYYYDGPLNEEDLAKINRDDYATDQEYEDAYNTLKDDIKAAYAEPTNWVKLTQSQNGTDGQYTLEVDEDRRSFTVTTMGSDKNAPWLNTRIKLVVHTECKEKSGNNEPYLPIYVEDFPLKQGPRDTNADADGKKLTFTTEHVNQDGSAITVSTTTVDTPQLRKSFPRTIVSVTKKWKDSQGNDTSPQDDIILHIYKANENGNVIKQDVLPPQRISKSGGNVQTVTWGDLKKYTGSDGTEVEALENDLHRYAPDDEHPGQDKISPDSEIIYVVEEEYVTKDKKSHFITTTELTKHSVEHKANIITELETEDYSMINEEKPKIRIIKTWENDKPEDRPANLETNLIITRYKTSDAVEITTTVAVGDEDKDGTFKIKNLFDKPITEWTLKDPAGHTVVSHFASSRVLAKGETESTAVRNFAAALKTYGFEFAGCTLEVKFEGEEGAAGETLTYVLQKGINTNVKVPMTLTTTEDIEITLTPPEAEEAEDEGDGGQTGEGPDTGDGGTTQTPANWDKTKLGQNKWVYEKELDFAASTFVAPLRGYEIEPAAFNYKEKDGYISANKPVEFVYQTGEDNPDAGYYKAELTNEHRAAKVVATKAWEDFDNAYSTRDEIQMHIDVNYTTQAPDANAGDGDGSGESGEGTGESGTGESTNEGEGSGDDGDSTNESASEQREKKDVLPAQKIAVDASGDGLTVTWGDGADYNSTKVGTERVYKTVKELYAELNPGTDPDAEEVTLTFDFSEWKYKDSNGDSYYVNELPSHDENGVQITYVIRETDKDGADIDKDDASKALVGYTTEVGEMSVSDPDGNGIITHSGTVTNKLETTNFTVTKQWYDAKQDTDHTASEIQGALVLSNQNGAVDASSLKTEGTTKPAAQKLETTPETGKTFTTTWTNLPKYITVDGSVVEAQYSVTENPFDGYVTTYKNEDDAATEEVDESSEKEKALNGGTIVNNQLVNVKVTKIWEDDDNRDGKRPTSLDITLQKGESDATSDDVATGDTPKHTLSGSNNSWETTWESLPYADENGTTIKYGAAEATTGLEGAGYTAGTVQDKGYNANTKTYSFEVTNNREPATIQIKVVKDWDDADNQDGKRNGVSADLTLYKKVAGSNSEQALTGNDETADTPVAYTGQKVLGTTSDGATVVTWTVPVYEAGQIGKAITYRVAEASIDGYTTTYAVTGSSADPAPTDGSVDASTVAAGETATVTITNTYTPEKTSVTITKTWDDAKYFEGEAAALTDDANAYSRQDVTFTLVGKTTDNTWDGTSQDVTLSATDAATAKSGTNNSTWTKTISDLPKYHDGLEITYTATETNVPDGFTKSVEDAAGRSAKNTPNEKEETSSLELIIKKTDGVTGRALEGATFTVKKADETVGTVSPTVAQPNADATATFTFTEDGTYTISETTTPAGYDAAADVTIKVDKQLKSITLEDDTSQNPVTKFFKWLYELFFGTDDGDMPASYDAQSNTLTIKNQPKTASISVEKAWVDESDQDGKRAAAASNLPKVTLEKSTDGGTNWQDVDTSGIAVPDANGLVKTGNNTVTWDNLPAYEDGKLITYRVKEINQIEGYTADFDASAEGAQDSATLTLYNADTADAQSGTATVTNTYTPETASVKVIKVWADGGNQDGKRPDNLSFTLSGKDKDNQDVEIAGATKSDYSVTKNAPDGEDGSYVWENLPVYKDGVKIKYSVTEDTNLTTVGYAAASYSATGVELTNGETSEIRVTNSYTPKTTSLTITKKWNDTDGDLFQTSGEPVADYTRPNVTVTVKGIYTDDNNQEQTAYNEQTVPLTGDTKKSITEWTSNSLTGLPVFADGGKQVKYIVTEEVPSGYSVAGTGTVEITPATNDGGTTYTLSGAEFTNTPITKEAYTPLDLTILKVEKGTTTVLAGATFGLYADSACTTAAAADQAIISGATGIDGKATVTFKEPGTYYIKETQAPTGYTASADTYTVVVEKGSISVTKKTDETPSTWFEKLYELIFGNSTKNVLEADGTTLKVENELKTANLTVTKTWDDSGNQDGRRVAATLQLQKKVGDGDWTDVAGKTGSVLTTYTSDKSTVTTFADLPAYENGQVVKYRVTETTVADYDATYDAGDGAYKTEGEGVDLLSSSDTTGSTTANKSIDTKNTYKPKTVDISIAKKWNDNDNQDGKRSSNNGAIVTLQKTTKDNPAESDWTAVSFANAADNGVAVPQSDATVKEWKNLPAYEGGALITYRVVETGLNSEYAIEKYEGGTGTGNNEIAYAPTDGEKTTKALTVTNKYPAESASVKVVKIWNDANNQDGKRVGSIDFKLVGSDGTTKTQTVAVSTTVADGAEAASYTWANLPVYKNGSKITYTVTEETTIEGYAAPAYEGTDTAKKNTGFELAKGDTYEVKVTNAYTPKLVDISVNKKWEDNNNRYSLRESNKNAVAVLEKSTDGATWSKVTGAGIANDVPVPQTDGQIAQWTNLPAYEGGKLITYRVSESDLANTYSAAYTGGTGSANNEFAYSGTAAKASAAMTVTNSCDYDADPPTDTGETFKGRYTSNGSDQSQEWTPSEWIDEIKTYANQPDGSPNEIESFTLVDKDGNEVTSLTTDEGIYEIDPQTGKVTFTPAPGFTEGKATTVTIRAKDRVGAITGKWPEATYTPEVVDNKQEATSVRNITYTYLTKDGTEASMTVRQEVKLVRYGAVDETAKTVSYEDALWQASDDANKDFPAQTSPAIEGWKASGNAAGQTPNPNTDTQAVYDEATNTFIYPDLHVLYVPQNAGTDERTTTDGKFTSVGGLQEQKSGSFTNLADKLTTKTLPDGSANTITGYTLIDPETGEEVPGGTLTIEGEGTYTIDPATGEVTFVPDANFPGGAATRVEVRAKDKLSDVLDETVAALRSQLADLDEDAADYEAQKAELEKQIEEYSSYQVPSGFYTPNVVLNAETATPTRTITYTYYTVDGDQVQGNVVQTLEFTRYGTYNPETGQVEYDNATWVAKDGKDTFDAVNSPSLEGTGGTGWHTDTEVVPALKVTDPTKPIEDEHVVYTPSVIEEYWVTYIDPATGRVIQDKIYQPKTTAEPPAPADPTREGYTFDGWDREVDADGNITYKAKWVPVETPEPPAPINWVRYIDSDGSTVYLPQTGWTIGTTEPAAPEDPTKDGYVFDGWDRTVDEDGNVTYIARWKPAETPQPQPTPQPSPTPSVRTAPVPTGTSASGVAVQATPKTADSAPYVPAAVVLLASAAAMVLSRKRLQEVCLAPAASAAARTGKHARR